MCPEFGKGAGFVLWRRALGGMEIGRLSLGFWGWGLRGARRDGEGVGEMCGGRRDGEVGGGMGRWDFWDLWDVWERGGMGMGCGEEGARRAGLGSWVTLYALRN